MAVLDELASSQVFWRYHVGRTRGTVARGVTFGMLEKICAHDCPLSRVHAHDRTTVRVTMSPAIAGAVTGGKR